MENIKKRFNQGFITNFDHTHRQLSHPWVLLTSKARIIEIIFAGSRFTDSKRWWVSRYSAGYSLLPRYQLRTCYCGVWEDFWVFCAYGEICVRLTSIIGSIAWSFKDFPKTKQKIRFGPFNCTLASWDNVTKNLIVSNTSAMLNITRIDFCFFRDHSVNLRSHPQRILTPDCDDFILYKVIKNIQNTFS